MQVFCMRCSLTSGFTWEVKKYQLTEAVQKDTSIYSHYIPRRNHHTLTFLRLKVAHLVLSQNKIFIFCLESRKWHIIFIISYILQEFKKNVFLISFSAIKFVPLGSKLHWVCTEYLDLSKLILQHHKKSHYWNFTFCHSYKAALGTQESFCVAKHWSLLAGLVVCGFLLLYSLSVSGQCGRVGTPASFTIAYTSDTKITPQLEPHVQCPALGAVLRLPLSLSTSPTTLPQGHWGIHNCLQRHLFSSARRKKYFLY